jgi:hypothetical protein
MTSQLVKRGEVMILEAILAVIKFIVIGIISLLPTIPKIQIDYLDGVFMALSSIDLIINLKVLAVCLALLFTSMHIQLLWSIIMWVVRKIPGIK